MNASWDDPGLRPRTEPGRLAAYRRLQSWYRDVQLGARPGSAPNHPQLGSMLHPDDVAAQPDLNFLHPDAYALAEARSIEVPHEDGVLDRHRLMHNLLSSMPMCFNLFGALRNETGFLPLFQLLFDQQATAITSVTCEWAPQPRENYLDDRTAFDAVVHYQRRDQPAFCAVEVKYTEPFSQKEYSRERYREVTGECGWFADPDGAAERLKHRESNQLWRDVLLAAALDNEGTYGRGSIAVVSLAGDPGADTAVEAVAAELHHGAAVRLIDVSLETIVDSVPWVAPDLQGWAHRFTRRYLDLTLPDGPDQSPDPGGPRLGQALTRP